MNRTTVKLSPVTDCFYQLPDDTDRKTLLETEKIFKKKYVEYSHRVGTLYFFRFGSRKDQQLFLATLEMACIRSGIPVERVFLPLD